MRLDVGAMHDEIDGERQAEPHDFGGERVLALEGAAIAGDVVGGHRVAILDRDLHVVEAGLPQIAHQCASVMPTPEVMRLV